jgi:hypothetical protein
MMVFIRKHSSKHAILYISGEKDDDNHSVKLNTLFGKKEMRKRCL